MRPISPVWIRRGIYSFVVAVQIAVITCSVAAEGEQGGIVFNASRVIFHETQNNASIEVRNESDVPRLMAVGIRTLSSDGLQDAGRSDDFLCAPSVSILGKNAVSPIRIVSANPRLPKDRESLYLLRVHFVPQSLSDPKYVNKGQINTVLTTYLKMIFRPVGLEKPRAVELAAENVTYRLESGHLIIENPTPYWLTVCDVEVDGKSMLAQISRKPLLSPKSGRVVLSDMTLDASPKRVSITIITDRGTVTDPIVIAAQL